MRLSPTDFRMNHYGVQHQNFKSEIMYLLKKLSTCKYGPKSIPNKNVHTNVEKEIFLKISSNYSTTEESHVGILKFSNFLLNAVKWN